MLNYFHIAACHPVPVTLPEPANEGALVGALVASGPHMLECLVSPESRSLHQPRV